MISIKKNAKPLVLVKKAAQWTRELLEEIKKGGDDLKIRQDKYRNTEIKNALKIETHGKCAYCESKILHIDYGDIEHITPKSVAPSLAFEWENLTLACKICNTKKGNKIDFVDPYTCNPEEEFDFLGPMIVHRRGRIAAERTRIELDLNRTALMERRLEAVDRIVTYLDRLDLVEDPEAQKLIKDTVLKTETADDREYAACVRAFVQLQVEKGELAIE